MGQAVTTCETCIKLRLPAHRNGISDIEKHHCDQVAEPFDVDEPAVEVLNTQTDRSAARMLESFDYCTTVDGMRCDCKIS